MQEQQLTADITGRIETLAYLAPGELDAEAPLFTAGIIDSLSLLDLVAFVEKHCAIKVPAADMRLEYWDSVSRIVRYVQGRQGA